MVGFPLLTLLTANSTGLGFAVLETQFKALQASMFERTGLIIPMVRVKARDTVPKNSYQLQMNEQVLASIAALRSDEFWLNLPVTGVNGRKWWGKVWKARDACASGPGEGAIVSGDEVARLLWQSNRYETRDSLAYVVFQVETELRKHSRELLSTDLVEHYLSKLADSFPVLVETTRQRFDVEVLTNTLRDRLEAQAPISDLRGILEELLAASLSQN